MNNNRYVVLTGAKNNAGDFYICHRGKELLSSLRQDREVMVLNGWQLFSEKEITLVNNSQALILMGGPALQKEMYGRVYPLCEDINRIKVPIVTMGIGWGSSVGTHSDIRKYPLSQQTLSLLKRINESGYKSSVRDYHTLQVLSHYKFDNFIMTGCPGLYQHDQINLPEKLQSNPGKISFSLGVRHVQDTRMKKQTELLLARLIKKFGIENVTVVFHHALEKNDYNEAYKKHSSSTNVFLQAHLQIAKWLDSMGIRKLDISGGVKEMLSHYADTDFHIGYRVHAHIYRISINKPSILIAEDGRGRALQHFLGGTVFCGGNVYKRTLAARFLNKLNVSKHFSDRENNANILAFPEEIERVIDNELSHGFPRTRQSIAIKNTAYSDMKRFIGSLP